MSARASTFACECPHLQPLSQPAALWSPSPRRDCARCSQLSDLLGDQAACQPGDFVALVEAAQPDKSVEFLRSWYRVTTKRLDEGELCHRAAIILLPCCRAAVLPPCCAVCLACQCQCL